MKWFDMEAWNGRWRDTTWWTEKKESDMEVGN
jgi:hypothetical protein